MKLSARFLFLDITRKKKALKLVFVLESTETEVSNVRPVVTVSAQCVVFLLWMSFIFSYDVPHFLCCYTRAATLGK